jgi:hypothetical protein
MFDIEMTSVGITFIASFVKIGHWLQSCREGTDNMMVLQVLLSLRTENRLQVASGEWQRDTNRKK